MKVLIVGGGGREHALAWKAAASKLTTRVYVAPGNAGTAAEPGVENVNLAADDINALADFAAREQIDLTIVGPEQPLVMGIADVFAERGLACCGPRRAAARLEGSKTFARDFMSRYGIPAPAYASFTEAAAARAYLNKTTYPVVIKADGLAAGKGVIIARDRGAATAALDDMLVRKKYGESGARVVIEEFIRGEEASFMTIVAGATLLPMVTSQDHKAAGDGDTGPNTGGMGAYSSAPIIDAAMQNRILAEIIRPTIAGLYVSGMPYTGFLYAGLMIDENGDPRVLEFNCRLGDPETQPMLLRLQSDLVSHCAAAVRGELQNENSQWDSRDALGVVMAAQGYPESPQTGDAIYGLAAAEAAVANDPTRKIFHSGTKLRDGKVVTAGGRVLCATALGDTVHRAQTAAYELAAQIHWNGGWRRSDIGHRAIARETDGR